MGSFGWSYILAFLVVFFFFFFSFDKMRPCIQILVMRLKCYFKAASLDNRAPKSDLARLTQQTCVNSSVCDFSTGASFKGRITFPLPPLSL